jgi:hypothetical protein
MMRPFIAKFAKEQRHHDASLFSHLVYSTELECLVAADKAGRAIDKKLVQIELTGSLTTQAQLDATRDEPTDR